MAIAQYKNTAVSVHGDYRIRFRMLLQDGMCESWHEVLDAALLPIARCPSLAHAVRIASALAAFDACEHEPA